MTTKQALREAVRRWGKTAGVRSAPKAATKVEREAARARVIELRANKPRLRPDWQTRQEWDAHNAAVCQWRQEEREAQDTIFSYRCTVGAIEHHIAFCVKGQGDTFEEAFAEADRRP